MSSTVEDVSAVTPTIWSAIPIGSLTPLVSRESFRRIESLSLPFRSAVHMACLECRLSSLDERPDFSFRIKGGGRIEAGTCPAAFRPGDEAWARAAGLMEWQGENASAIPFLWYAFDMDGDPSALPLPCISVCVDPSFYARRMDPARYTGKSPLAPAELRRIMEACHVRLHGHDSARETGDWLELCARSLDGVGHANHLSFMLSRSPATVKFDVRIRKDSVEAYLRAIGWDGAVRGLQEAIGRFMPWEGHVQLNLVLHPRLMRPLEAEFLMVPKEAMPSHRKDFLAALVDTGLCGAGKAEVLAEFDRRPMALPRDPGMGSALMRGWYSKILFREDCPVEAKAYVGLQLRESMVPTFGGL